MTFIKTMSRRTFLYAANACLALPFLPAFADDKQAADQEANKDIKRLVCMGVGYGFVLDTFYPTTAGRFADIGLTEGLSPLQRHQNDLTVVQNLTSGQTGDPHSGSTNFLTGVDNVGVAGKTFFNAVSFDQVAAEVLCKDTRYKSLIVAVSDLDGHGRGLSLSWDRSGNPLNGLKKPLEIYNALFANKSESKEQVQQRLQRQESVLDAMRINFNSVSNLLGKDDQAKIDEYFQSIRQAEIGLQQEVSWLKVEKPTAPFAFTEAKSGETEVKLICDLMALALHTDATRVITYQMPNKTIIEAMGLKQNPHGLSHYEIAPAYKDEARLRDKKYTELYAYFLDRLKDKQDANGKRLFDSCITCMGSSIRGQHVMKSVPALLSGGGGKRIERGQSIILPKEDTPLSNLWLTLLQEVGVSAEKFGLSTGTVPEILS